MEFLHPLHINERNIIESIAEALSSSIAYHELFHSLQRIILNKLKEDLTIKDRNYLLDILNKRNNREIQASAFEIAIYYLEEGFNNAEVYETINDNIFMCREYIEEVNEPKDGKYLNEYIPYNLGFCYGGIIVAKYKSSLAENIQDIIKDLIYLDEKRVIDTIKLYGDNLKDNLKRRLYG